ncbi:hypothetical protein SAMN06298212_10215 [Ruaniaceae bacterium KH17]|nr:hypothetical protein SAMN06298212_10215 [Ruaniaceae bacterium KH17]
MAVAAPAVPDGAERTADVPLILYHDWVRRSPSAMRIWIPEAR